MKWDFASKTLPRSGEKLCGDAVFARAGSGCDRHQHDSGVLIIDARADASTTPEDRE